MLFFVRESRPNFRTPKGLLSGDSPFEGQSCSLVGLYSNQSCKAMTSVWTSSKFVMNLPLLLLLLITFQENLGLKASNKTIVRTKRYATHLNPIYRHFDFLKRDGMLTFHLFSCT